MRPAVMANQHPRASVSLSQSGQRARETREHSHAKAIASKTSARVVNAPISTDVRSANAVCKRRGIQGITAPERASKDKAAYVGPVWSCMPFQSNAPRWEATSNSPTNKMAAAVASARTEIDGSIMRDGLENSCKPEVQSVRFSHISAASKIAKLARHGGAA